jgi:hypothetical protein
MYLYSMEVHLCARCTAFVVNPIRVQALYFSLGLSHEFESALHSLCLSVTCWCHDLGSPYANRKVTVEKANEDVGHVLRRFRIEDLSIVRTHHISWRAVIVLLYLRDFEVYR